MNTINPYDIAKSYAEDIMAESQYWDEEDIYDIASQHADNSCYVIYYSQAHDFVRALPSDVQDAAEQDVADFGGAESYDDYAVKIAYCALRDMIAEAVHEMLEEEEA